VNLDAHRSAGPGEGSCAPKQAPTDALTARLVGDNQRVDAHDWPTQVELRPRREVKQSHRRSLAVDRHKHGVVVARQHLSQERGQATPVETAVPQLSQQAPNRRQIGQRRPPQPDPARPGRM
jgi:hypothetical protein